VQEANQARAINEVINALKPAHLCPANAEDAPSLLRVVNGINTQTSSMITVRKLRAHREIINSFDRALAGGAGVELFASASDDGTIRVWER
jgi:WD40 repeat protein